MKKILVVMVTLFALVFIHGAIQTNFSANLSNCAFTYTDTLNGSYTGTVANGTGEMSGITSVSGIFKNIDNGDGTVYVLTTSSSVSGRNTFTIQSNHLVNLATGTISDSANMPTTYTRVTLKVKSGVNKGTYVSSTASSSGTTDASNFSLTKMSLGGNF